MSVLKKYLLAAVLSILFIPAMPQERADSVLASWARGRDIRITDGNRVRFLKSGTEKFDDMFSHIMEARHSVHLEYFNFRNDSIADALFSLLSVKARQGVEVRALFDAFGNMSNNRPLKKKHVKAICSHGVELRKYDAVSFPWVNHIFPRDHRKIVVIDGRVGYTGGMNVADYYLVGLPGIGQWRDMHVRIEGPAVADLQDIFINTWEKETREILDKGSYHENGVASSLASRPINNAPLSKRDSLILHLLGDSGQWKAAYDEADSLLRAEQKEKDHYVAGPVNRALDENGQVLALQPQIPSEDHLASVAILDRTPGQKSSVMRDFYATALNSAQSRVQLINPYFAPTRKVSRALKNAIRRGVDVQIIIPSKSDIPFTPDVAYRAVNRLRKLGASVYLYDGGFHHSKILMVDGLVCSVGSTNLDSRSLRFDYEVNAVIFSKDATAELSRMFENDKKDSRQLTDSIWAKRSSWRKFVGWIGSAIRCFL